MLSLDRSTIRGANRRDRIARWIITLGGVTIIASVVAIILLIVGVTLPLFLPASATVRASGRLPASLPANDILALGVRLDLDQDEAVKSLTADVLGRDGTCTFLDLAGDPQVLGSQRVASPGGGEKSIRAIERHDSNNYSLLWSDGSVSLVEVTANTEFSKQGRRSIAYGAATRASVPADAGPLPVLALLRCFKDPDHAATTTTCVRLLPDSSISVWREAVVENEMLGTEEKNAARLTLKEGLPGPITALTMDREGTTLYAGTKDGHLVRWKFTPEGKVGVQEVLLAFPDGREITSLAMLLGDVSLAVGDAEGDVTTWFVVRGEPTARLRRIHDLSRHDGPVREILPSTAKKTLASIDAGGSVHLDYPTSERHLVTLTGESPLGMIGFDPRGAALIGLDREQNLTVWQISAKYPEISWSTLFGRVFYEGYDRPEFAWQTTGGNDFEPKVSLVPLLFGTLKGTLYAMLLAVPLALFAAAYTSHFTTPSFKKAIKPVVEIMAAVPSVVIGFLIALWLAPIVERWILAVFAAALTIPLMFVLFMIVWQMLRHYDWAKRIENGYEFLVLIPVIAVGIALAALMVSPVAIDWFGGNLETALFHGHFKLWLNETLDMRYDQRNCIIIAFGLGFAVIPIIFSIAEDSLSNVPHSLTAASMAMGASRWQTLWRVVLPSASPGIFAAMMIGFGRAVGETMIVLMATGNTPILDWSPFNGMRTLSANIAVEIPEAPVGGTLYRVLFLCAVLLFLLTFLLNTAAELVRQQPAKALRPVLELGVRGKKFWKQGEPLVWATGGALAITILMTATMLIVVMVNGLGVFWPHAVAEITLTDGHKLLGIPTQSEVNTDNKVLSFQFKTGNRELDPQRSDFRWYKEGEIEAIAYPPDVFVLERQENGDFYGYLKDVQHAHAGSRRRERLGRSPGRSPGGRAAQCGS